MKKRLLLTLVTALMVFGLYSTASFAYTRIYEGSGTYPAGTYEFYPTETSIYIAEMMNSSGNIIETAGFTSNGVIQIFLQQNQRYELEIPAYISKVTIKKIYAGQLRQGEFSYSFGNKNDNVIYTLVVSGSTDSFHFKSSGTGDPYIEVFKESDMSNSIIPVSGDTDDIYNTYNFECTYKLDPGTYYVVLSCYAKSNGTVGKFSVTHDAHGINNAIHSNGYIEQKCFICNYVAATGYLPPAKPAIATKNIKKKTLAVTIAPAQYATMYQIQYATKKNFKKAKNLYTATGVNAIKKLKKGKTYYVRVRSLNNGGFSAWSAVKKVKIKK